MRILSSMFGKGPKRFVSEAGHRENVVRQTAMTPQVVRRLHELGASAADRLKLEFFFYTDEAKKASALVDELRGLGYEVEAEPAAQGKGLFIVTGWTTPIEMSERAAVAWTEEMCQRGYQRDAEFDGWGTHAPGTR